MVAKVYRPVVALFALATACTSSPVGCGLVGCASAVTVDVRQYVVTHAGTVAIRVCANDSCSTFGPGRFTFAPGGPISGPLEVLTHEHKRVDVRVTLTAPSGSATFHERAALRINQPNGAACGPTCYFVGLRLTSGGRLEVEAPQE